MECSSYGIIPGQVLTKIKRRVALVPQRTLFSGLDFLLAIKPDGEMLLFRWEAEKDHSRH